MKFRSDLGGVELHVHLDGAVRLETLYELGPNLNKRTLEELKKELSLSPPYTLTSFLQRFSLITPVMAGKKEVLTRVASEFVEDCANRSKLCYVEAKIAPHLLTGPDLDAEGVTVTVLDAFQYASRQFGVEARLLLTVLREYPEYASDVLTLSEKYKPHGVVGIDVAGDDSKWASQGMDPRIIDVFQQAKKREIHRTVHCGVNAPAASVWEAVDQLHAERIGHGYTIINDADVYSYVKAAGIHFELCPMSSIITGSVSEDDLTKHPIVRLIQDDVNFSINTDDPILTKSCIPDEVQFCVSKMNLPPSIASSSNINGARSCFLLDEDRDALMQHVKQRNK